MTGSTANLIAISLIMSLAGEKVYYTDWMFAEPPGRVIAMLITWSIGPRLLIPAAGRSRTSPAASSA